jgi:hypothetical protein
MDEQEIAARSTSSESVTLTGEMEMHTAEVMLDGFLCFE